jgi:hypothetical protein
MTPVTDVLLLGGAYVCGACAAAIVGIWVEMDLKPWLRRRRCRDRE